MSWYSLLVWCQEHYIVSGIFIWTIAWLLSVKVYPWSYHVISRRERVVHALRFVSAYVLLALPPLCFLVWPAIRWLISCFF